MKYWKIYKIFVRNNFEMLKLSLVNMYIGIGVFLFMQLMSFITISMLYTDGDINAAYTTFGIYLMAKGIDHLITDNLWLVAQNKVINGDISTYICRPIPTLFLVISEVFKFDAIGEILLGLFVLIVYAPEVITDPVNYLFLMIIIINASFFFFSIKLICSSIAFWTMRSMSILNLVYSLTDFVKYQKTLYPEFIQKMFTFIFPIFLVYIVPNEDVYLNLKMVAISSFIVYGLVIFGMVLFNRGVKRYEDAGGK